jgi:hypothetical protein
MTIDSVPFFESLATEMNAHPERYAVYGEADMVVALVMQRDVNPFAVRVVFEGMRCEGVDGISLDEARAADFRLEGPAAAWEAMFADIAAHGRASGRQTINSLALLDDIPVRGTDPMGLDKFSRFNQTLQLFLDGAAHVGALAG